jgi:hypothetical protein
VAGDFAIAEWNEKSKIFVKLMKILCPRLAKRGTTFYWFFSFLVPKQ